MQVETFLRNKIKRQIDWNGQNFVFTRYKTNEYHELTDEVEETFELRGIFHEGGGYGGMLNQELYEREGSREISVMKPMIMCLYDDVSSKLAMDDRVIIGGDLYFLVSKNDLKGMKIAYDISLEVVEVENNG